MRKVKITKITFNKEDKNAYGILIDSKTKDVIIDAPLDYIFDCINKRSYTLKN